MAGANKVPTFNLTAVGTPTVLEDGSLVFGAVDAVRGGVGVRIAEEEARVFLGACMDLLKRLRADDPTE